MVKPKHELLKWSIKNKKMRIKHNEKAGNGDAVMRDKKALQKIERTAELLRQAGFKI